MKPRWYRLLLSVDQFFNVLILNGSEDETISSHCWRNREKGWHWRRAIRAIDWLFSRYESNHCQNSFESSIKE